MRGQFIIKGKRRKGYLLIESLVSLMICICAVWTVVVMIKYVGQTRNRHQVDFYSYIQILESERFKFELQNVRSKDVRMYSPVTKKKYHMQLYDDMIRITGVKMGHMRALTAVKDVNWSRDRGCLKTVVTFSNGQQCYAYSKLSEK